MAFSDRAILNVKWAKGNAAFPIPKDFIGDWRIDFWLLAGPQVGERNGTIDVQYNFYVTDAYTKAVADITNYTLKTKV